MSAEPALAVRMHCPYATSRLYRARKENYAMTTHLEAERIELNGLGLGMLRLNMFERHGMHRQ